MLTPGGAAEAVQDSVPQTLWRCLLGGRITLIFVTWAASQFCNRERNIQGAKSQIMLNIDTGMLNHT